MEVARHVQSAQNKKLVIFWQYFKKKVLQLLVCSTDGKHSDILRNSRHVHCYLYIFFLFFLRVAIFRRTGQSFFAYMSSFITNVGTGIGLLLLATLANIFVKAVFIVKVRPCEYDMPCALERIVMANSSESIWNLAFQPLKTSYLH